jgi:hypothetical protein
MLASNAGHPSFEEQFGQRFNSSRSGESGARQTYAVDVIVLCDDDDSDVTLQSIDLNR